MEKEQSQNNPKNISEKEEEVKASSDQTSENSQTDEPMDHPKILVRKLRKKKKVQRKKF